jgi:hypothetical protein
MAKAMVRAGSMKKTRKRPWARKRNLPVAFATRASQNTGMRAMGMKRSFMLRILAEREERAISNEDRAAQAAQRKVVAASSRATGTRLNARE